MRIAALATGIGVPVAGFAGQVADVHARAALLKLSDGRCITLLGGELGRQPRGINIDLAEGTSLRLFLSANAEFAKRGGVVRSREAPLRSIWETQNNGAAAPRR